MKKPKKMFSKTSLTSFVYDIINVFNFPYEDQTIKNIYEKYKIQKCFVYQNPTNTDKKSLFFVFICNLNSQLNEKDSRKIIFEVLTQSKVHKRLDLSDNFWTQLNVCNRKIKKKQVGLYEIKSVDKAKIVTMVVKPK